MGHWSVARQITPRHISFTNNENVIFVEHSTSKCVSMEPLPVEAYTWLVKNLSWEGDTVVDVGSKRGYVMVASLKEGRNAVWLSTASECELASLQTRVSTPCEAVKLKVGNLHSI